MRLYCVLTADGGEECEHEHAWPDDAVACRRVLIEADPKRWAGATIARCDGRFLNEAEAAAVDLAEE